MTFAVVPANRLSNYGLEEGPETLDQRLTWNELAALEPRLVALEKQVLDLQRTWATGYCFNAEWYGYGYGQTQNDVPGVKHEIVSLVGRLAELPQDSPLATCETFDTVTIYLYDLMPGCDHGDEACRSERLSHEMPPDDDEV